MYKPTLAEVYDTGLGSYKPAMPPDHEWFEIFPDMEEDCRRNLAIEQEKTEKLKYLFRSNGIPESFIPNNLATDNAKRLNRILRVIEFRKNPTPRAEQSYKDIALAKQFPIEYVVEPNRAGFIYCPKHEENRPSCKIYKDNRWYCFSCGEGGDVIDLVIHRHHLTFKEAVDRILTHDKKLKNGRT